MEGLQKMSMEALLANHDTDKLCKSRLENLKNHLTAISKDYEKRAGEIHKNKAKYSEEGLADQRTALDASIRTRVNELVDGHGFTEDIRQTKKELAIPGPESGPGEIVQLLKEQEVRRSMTDAGDRFQEFFLADIVEGNPLVIKAIEGSPVPFPIASETLEQGKKRRLEILNPVASEKLKALKTAQGTLEAMASSAMPFGGGRDPIREISNAEPDAAESLALEHGILT